MARPVAAALHDAKAGWFGRGVPSPAAIAIGVGVLVTLPATPASVASTKAVNEAERKSAILGFMLISVFSNVPARTG